MYFRAYLNLNTGMGEEMGTRTFIAAVAMGVLATGGMTLADSTSVSGSLSSDTSVGLKPGTDNLTVQFNALASSPPPADFNAFVGQINWTTNDPNFLGTGKTVTNFSTYCIEGTQNVIFGGSYSWSVTQLTFGSAPSTSVPNPGPSLSAIQVQQMYYYYDNNYENVNSSSNPNEYATAFQLGLWEIVSGDTLSGEPTDSTMFGGGSFTASGSDNGAFALAAGWVDKAVNGTLDSDAVALTLYALTDSGIQDQIVALPPSPGGLGSGAPFPTPTPAALPAGLSIFGCLGAAAFFRRRRQIVVA